jgi:hypothetical protein
MQFSIFIGGDISQIKNSCRKWCNAHPLCVTVTPTTYIFTGGAEEGAQIGLINYPRFPSELNELFDMAESLAYFLLKECSQDSFCIVGPDETVWVSYKDEHR